MRITSCPQMPRLRGVSIAGLGLAVIPGCVDPVDPAPEPVIPSVRLELSEPSATVADTLVRIRATAETNGRLHSLYVYDSIAASPRATTILSWEHTAGATPVSAVDTTAVVRLQAVPGQHRLMAVMNHDVAGQSRTDTVQLTVDLYKRATFEFGTSVPDTVYGRSLIVHARVSPAISTWQLALVMDPGTPQEKVLTGPVLPWDLVRPRPPVDGWREFDFAFPYPLESGTHRAELRLTDEQGVRSVGKEFHVHVPHRPFTVRALPGLSAGESRALGVNSVGDAVGWSADAGGARRAVVWRRSGGVEQLATPAGAASSEAVAVNDAGDVAGAVESRPVVWEDGVLRSLELPAGAPGRSVDINAQGWVLYQRLDVRPHFNSYHRDSSALIDRDGVASYVASMSTPHALNNAGGIVGTRPSGYPPLEVTSATFPVPGPPVVLGSGHERGAFVAVNDRTQVLGHSGVSLQAVYIAQPGKPSVDLTADLGGPATPAQPIWMNASATVLARSGTWHLPDRADDYYLWSAGTTSKVTLATAGWQVLALSRMNDLGQIVGQARETATGALRAVVLDPVP